MNVKQEIIDSIKIISKNLIDRICPVITFGVVKSILPNERCTVSVDGVEQNLAYYGNAPTVGQKYPVFIPFNNMSLGFVGGVGVPYSNTNLLMNPFFTVNQRGVTSFTGSGYFIDGWRSTNASAVFSIDSNNIVTLGNNGSNSFFRQRMESHPEKGKTYTLSFLVKGTAKGYVAFNDDSGNLVGTTAPFNGVFSDWTVVSKTLTMPDDSASQCSMRCDAGYSFQVKAGKLEPGSVSTITNDVPPAPATELLKCRRYFQRFGGVGTSWHGYGGVNSTPNKRLYITIPCAKMRATPAVSYSGTIRCFSDVGTGYEIESIAVSSADDTSVTLAVTMAAALDGGKVYLLRTDGTAYIDLSAEL